MVKLDLDPALAERGRKLAGSITDEVFTFIHGHTTVSVERAVLRLMGVDGVDQDGVPLPNLVVDRLQQEGALSRGAALFMARAAARSLKPGQVAAAVAAGRLDPGDLPAGAPEAEREKAAELARWGLERIRRNRSRRSRLLQALGEGPQPLIYAIVATGNIYEDVSQARAAARQGADIIAVIRSTGQSLLDYVPHGATTHGVGGTFATRENFRIMRAALDDAGREAGRYIRLTNYCSGLCMPEIAAIGALERLDMMLNDAMYGIIFRDINMRRTFVDQYFSRLINGFAGVVINTGEDNYLTTADACEAAPTVLASNLINEQFALKSGLTEEQIGLGHAMEMDPGRPDVFLWELAQAQLIREVFPRSPVKYMPPTKYMTGNIFRGHVQDALFNVVSVLTGQGIHLLGMPTEAIHTPHLQDRWLSIESCKMVFNALRSLKDEISYREDGVIRRRALKTLAEAVELLEAVKKIGLMEAIARGFFAEIKRRPEGGRGLDGVVPKAPDYFNPFMEVMAGGRNCAVSGRIP